MLELLRIHSFTTFVQEVIQNADDARATEVKFYLDYRNLETLPISLLQSQSGASARDQAELSKQFTGPALLSYNNAPFREEDWEGIRTTYQSVKANSPNKVGKFGIGFNSVYHITGKLACINRHITLCQRIVIITIHFPII